MLRDLDFADPYVDDIIICTPKSQHGNVLDRHEAHVRAVLDVLKEHQLEVDPKKAHLFMGEGEFCGHILREGCRSPAPGKLAAIQK